MSSPPAEPTRHRFSVADYHRMAEVGLLAPDARVELIDGEIIHMAPIGSDHSGSVGWLNKRLVDAVGNRALVWPQNPVRLSDFSEPQPDLALLRPRDDFYRRATPVASDVLLMIEVSNTSLAYDRDRKLPLYAVHGVPVVWLLDLNSQRLTVASRPLENGYADVTTLDPARDGDTLARMPCGLLDDMHLDLRELLDRDQRLSTSRGQ